MKIEEIESIAQRLKAVGAELKKARAIIESLENKPNYTMEYEYIKDEERNNKIAKALKLAALEANELIQSSLKKNLGSIDATPEMTLSVLSIISSVAIAAFVKAKSLTPEERDWLIKAFKDEMDGYIEESIQIIREDVAREKQCGL